ncbi:unnamed protein product [Trichogramma brassicae]|uniref:Uncharacterized protein n=1 Tax=Trichogramma brassicae TaxID=86971 RepID=A0A6H5IRL7_9HYME|nr:unnamed protein product [Trichogramma brassicae]
MVKQPYHREKCTVCICMSELRLRRAGYTRCECERESASRAVPAFAQRLSVDHVEVSQERRFARRRCEQRRAITSDERALRSSVPIGHSSPSSSRVNNTISTAKQTRSSRK